MIVSLFKNFSIYFVFSVLTAILPIALMPILTRYMTPEDYGLYSIYAMLVMFFGVLYRFELNQSLKLEFVGDEKDFKLFLGSAFLFSVFLLIPFFIVVFLVYLFFDDVFGVSSFWLFVVLPLVFFKAQILNLHHLWQISSRSFLFGLWGFLANFSVYALSIILLVFFDMGWIARVFGEWFVCFFAFFVALFFLNKHFGLRFVFEFSFLKKMLIFCLPLIPGAIVSYLMLASDRFFIAELVSMYELGLYSVALQFSFSIAIVFTAVYPVWESYIYNKVDVFDSYFLNRLLLVLVGIFLVGIFCVYVLSYLIAIVIPYLVDDNFVNAYLYLIPCLYAALGAGIYRLTNALLVLMRKTKEIFFIGLLLLLVNFILMFQMVSSFGAAGAGYSLAMTFCLGALINVLTACRNRKAAVH